MNLLRVDRLRYRLCITDRRRNTENDIFNALSMIMTYNWKIGCDDTKYLYAFYLHLSLLAGSVNIGEYAC